MQSNQVLTYDEVKEFWKEAPRFFAEGQGFDGALDLFKKSKETKPEYEILSFEHTHVPGEFLKKGINGLFSCPYQAGEWTKERLIKSKFPIHSVKRLSDGEVFTVGGVCKQGFIKRLDYSDWSKQITAHIISGIYECDLYLWDLEKVTTQPKVLFKTNDGKEIVQGDRYWTVDPQNFLKKEMCTEPYFFYPFSIVHTFSTESAADLFISVVRPKKEKLFTTTNGVNIYPNDYYIKLDRDYGITLYTATQGGDYSEPYSHRTFSTEEAAKEWIVANKPTGVCYREFVNYFQDVDVSMEEIFAFFKQKINQ